MAKRTTVWIYEVDSAGAIGAQVGMGALVGPRGVFVHPPLSHEMATWKVPKQLRVEIRSCNPEKSLVEVIDVHGEPQIVGKGESVGPLVGLRLSTEATSPIDRMTCLSRVQTEDQLVQFAVPRLASDDPDVWNRWCVWDAFKRANVFCRICRWAC